LNNSFRKVFNQICVLLSLPPEISGFRNSLEPIELLYGLVDPLWNKWRGSDGQTPCPVPLVPRRSEDPLLLVLLVSRRSEDPRLLVPHVPRTPTCANLCHLVVPLVLRQLSFLIFFFGFLNVISFSEELF